MASVWIEPRRSGRDKTFLVCWKSEQLELRGSKICYTKPQAKTFQDKKREELRAIELGIGAPAVEVLSWAQFAAQYEAHARSHKAANTWSNFEKPTLEDFGAFTGGKPPQALATQEIERWKLKLLKTLKPNTVRMRLRSLRAILGYAVRLGLIPINPAARVPMPAAERVGRVLSDAEAHAILGNVSATVGRGLVVALHTGARRNELLSLEWKSVRGGAIEIEARHSKTGRGRVIPLHAAAARAMGPPQAAGRVFPGLSGDMLESQLRAAAVKLKLGRVRIHDFRHTWATRFMERTGDLFALMQLGGWRSVASMTPYQHLTRARAKGVLKLRFGRASHWEPTERKLRRSKKR